MMSERLRVFVVECERANAVLVQSLAVALGKLEPDERDYVLRQAQLHLEEISDHAVATLGRAFARLSAH